MHGPENVAAGALQNYIRTLRREVTPQGINIVQLKLGTFDYSNEPGEWALVTTREEGDNDCDDPSQTESTSDVENGKPSGWKSAFTFQYPNRKEATARVRGSRLSELHDGVFDAMKRGKGAGGTMFVGRGSRMYDFVARWVPDGVVGWMMGRKGLDRDLGKGKTKENADWEKVGWGGGL